MNELAQHRYTRRIIAWCLRRMVRLARSGRLPQALKVALRLANLAPSIPALQIRAARIALFLGDTDKARRAAHLAIEANAQDRLRYYMKTANLFLGLHDLDAAAGCLEKARFAHPNSPRVWTLLGDYYRNCGSADDAAQCFDTALTLSSSDLERFRALNGIAGCFADTGRKSDAGDIYSRMLELAPDATPIYYHLAVSNDHISLHDDIVLKMHEMLKSGKTSALNRMNLHYALGMIFDRHRQYAEAFAHFTRANSIRAQHQKRHDDNPLESRVDSNIKVFSKEMVHDLSQYGNKTEFLICIVGMPRSGTTLLEQILSSHPNVVGLGERMDIQLLTHGLQTRMRSRHPYPLCCRSMSPRDVRELSQSLHRQLCQSVSPPTRVVTKYPGDSWDVGFIKILFPNAKIIHAQRHPIDTCLSCYMQNFQFVDFSTSLTRLARTYKLHQKIMRHWRDVLPMGSVFEAPYEALVANPEPVVRRLHEFCGLPYNEDWPAFWNQSSRVDTASKWQVRRPIYRSSVERWRHYAAFLGPLLDLAAEPT